MSIFDENNHKSSTFRDTSFVGQLREKNKIDAVEYLHLEDWLWATFESMNGEIPKKIIVRYGIMASLVQNSLIHHQNMNETSELGSSTKEEFDNLLKRMHQVLDGLSNGKIPERMYLQKLRNT